ncbi:MAG: tRNA (5-methylaminomethyl-2-thiouridine)(34)-methyltransferase MnmD [Bacteroidota bacterium]
MKRSLRLTEDGSHTLYLNDLEEPYHSMHGAIQESRHVFIIQGFKSLAKSKLHILEIGLGTGLNLLLSYQESKKEGIGVHYHAVEKFPLIPAEFSGLNYETLLEGLPEGLLQQIHTAPWEHEIDLSSDFSLYKEQSDFRSMNPKGPFDLVYFDAFAPEKQPELWTSEVFSVLGRLTNPGAILVTYSSKGIVRRALKDCGFQVKKVPGPPGKREMIRAVRI